VALRLNDADHALLSSLVNQQQAQFDQIGAGVRADAGTFLRGLLRREARAAGLLPGAAPGASPALGPGVALPAASAPPLAVLSAASVKAALLTGVAAPKGPAGLRGQSIPLLVQHFATAGHPAEHVWAALTDLRALGIVELQPDTSPQLMTDDERASCMPSARGGLLSTVLLRESPESVQTTPAAPRDHAPPARAHSTKRPARRS
jgi:hypothetical protein